MEGAQDERLTSECLHDEGPDVRLIGGAAPTSAPSARGTAARPVQCASGAGVLTRCCALLATSADAEAATRTQPATWSEPGPFPNSPARICCTASGCGASGAALTSAAACGSRTRCSRGWTRAPSPNGPRPSCAPPVSGPEPDGRDQGRVHSAGGPNRRARRRRRVESGDRRAAVHQRQRRRLPLSEGVPEARRHVAPPVCERAARTQSARLGISGIRSASPIPVADAICCTRTPLTTCRRAWGSTGETR